ncbi:MAG: 16S rRNA (guanine(527)-N(7))-methyltransferase RsmG [Holosporales bacterium]|jgi:16S rRNA (guanine527-N7)-methyltransferase|nr:16S rRNA (guanine(527)-N(7))-methyltransferase RsmG [Holosporales bacterium]
MDKKSSIEQYISLLINWNLRMNLVQTESVLHVMDRHVRDSWQISLYIDPSDTVLDVGSGAGFPGVILSIFEFKKVILCENNFKKVTFLREVKQKLGLNFDIFDEDVRRISVRERLPGVTLVSRAFGDMTTLMSVMEKLEVKNGVFHKGKKYVEELEKADKCYTFDFQIKQSLTSNDGVIVLISHLERKL